MGDTQRDGQHGQLYLGPPTHLKGCVLEPRVLHETM
jgi:hypothetical protein